MTKRRRTIEKAISVGGQGNQLNRRNWTKRGRTSNPDLEEINSGKKENKSIYSAIFSFSFV
jgi:hypothetical protein